MLRNQMYLIRLLPDLLVPLFGAICLNARRLPLWLLALLPVEPVPVPSLVLLTRTHRTQFCMPMYKVPQARTGRQTSGLVGQSLERVEDERRRTRGVPSR